MIKKKHYVCTHYGIQECMTLNDFGNMLWNCLTNNEEKNPLAM